MNELTSSKEFRLERLDTRIRASRSREKGVNLNKWPKRPSTQQYGTRSLSDLALYPGTQGMPK